MGKSRKLEEPIPYISSLHINQFCSRCTIKLFWWIEALEDAAGVPWDTSITRQIKPELFLLDWDGWKTAFHESAWKTARALGAVLDRLPCNKGESLTSLSDYWVNRRGWVEEWRPGRGKICIECAMYHVYGIPLQTKTLGCIFYQ